MALHLAPFCKTETDRDKLFPRVVRCVSWSTSLRYIKLLISSLSLSLLVLSFILTSIAETLVYIGNAIKSFMTRGRRGVIKLIIIIIVIRTKSLRLSPAPVRESIFPLFRPGPRAFLLFVSAITGRVMAAVTGDIRKPTKKKIPAKQCHHQV